MDLERHFLDVLSELNPYLDNPPLPGSAEHLRFTELIEEVGRHQSAGPQHPFAEQVDELGVRIDAVVRRRNVAGYARDPSWGAVRPPPHTRP